MFPKRLPTTLRTLCLLLPIVAISCLQANANSSPGAWSNTIALTTMNGRLYTVETSGALYQTDLGTGKWIKIGKSEFGNTRYLFAGSQHLYTIETDGSLYRVSPANGSWGRVGAAGEWRNTIAAVAYGDRLYSLEQGGTL